MITILYAIIELNNVLGPILYSSHDKQTGDTYAYSRRRHSVHFGFYPGPPVHKGSVGNSPC